MCMLKSAAVCVRMLYPQGNSETGEQEKETEKPENALDLYELEMYNIVS